MNPRFGIGDLLASDADALVNPVNCVGVMGAGLARQFARVYPAMAAAFERACADGHVRPGRMWLWPTGARAPRFVVGFPTKRHWRDASRLDDIDAGLVDLRAVITRHGITSVAVPPLGCGLGGLNWHDVAPRIAQALRALDGVDVRIHAPARDVGMQQATSDSDAVAVGRQRWLDGCEPCTGCGGARHHTVGATPCVACGAVRWTLVVTGSRSLTDAAQVREAARDALAELIDRFGCRPRLTLHGDAPGVDRILAARLAQARWPVEAVPADWETHRRKAGVLRDLSMAGRADALLAVWDGTSAGTGHTIAFARKRGLRIACRIVGRHRVRDDQGDTQQPVRRRAPAPRQPSQRTRDQADARRARTLLAVPMACQPSSRRTLTQPRTGSATAGYRPSRQRDRRPLTGREQDGGLGDTQLSASVWDLSRGRGAQRWRHPARSHSATSSMLLLAWVGV